MPRFQAVTQDTANQQTSELLSGVAQKLGRVPNIIATMANSHAVAGAYLAFSQSLAGGALSPKLREKIALAVGEANSCDYCVAAHTAIGQSVGLTEDDARDARQAFAADDQENAALRFARQIVDGRGAVSDADVQSVRDAGYDDGEVAEIVANVALNLFTNYFNHVAETEVDFPAPPELLAV